MNKSLIAACFALLIFSACSSEKKQETKDETITDNTIENQTTENKQTTASVVSKEQLEGMLTAYFDLKNALVSTDAEQAKSASGKLLSQLNDGMNALRESASNIQQKSDVEDIRAEFQELSKGMYEVVKNNSSAKDETVYKQFCPMAFNNTGGYWLSSEKEIKNPYFGDKMLKCGKVQEEL
ncbi:DUF3347 domain-containing protein [Marivirga sp. S37H4]|uniref:DUF3347 domain-containing protein n=1 Tax=Marivirga aurantiaca TaxID=2802615 RepID=A0A934X1V2_9BACT|nr:DUF3347 domain-containing protein [Marivirga aurantiaca]MBK6266942.1 DUF3347 domain-containing protein [Marivirga aurantiaca]